MAITEGAQWWIRTDGDDTNGAGFDSTISGAGTNYCDQAAAELSLTDFATAGIGSTTLTSSTGGFTSAMVGNAVHLASGTNLTPGYYFITGYTDTNTVTLDRAPDDGVGGVSGGTGKIGGAWGTMRPCATNYTGYTLPDIAAPMIRGNVVNLRGNGSDDPSTPDYQVPNNSYTQFKGGDTLCITYKSYNGRAFLAPYAATQTLLAYTTNNIIWIGFKFHSEGTGNAGNGIMGGASHYFDCTFDQNGINCSLMAGPRNVVRCRFYNSGGGGISTSNVGISGPAYGAYITENIFEDIRGIAINTGSNGYTLIGNIIRNIKGIGIELNNASDNFPSVCTRNTVVNCSYEGVKDERSDGGSRFFTENLIVNNGTYGYKLSNAPEVIPAQTEFYDNVFYNNASGNLDGYTPSTDYRGGDLNQTLTADPFVDSGNGNFALNNVVGGGALCRGAINHWANTPQFSSTTDYSDVGAVQAEAVGGPIRVSMNGGIN